MNIDRDPVLVQRDVRIPTADPEVTLSADLFLPRDGDPVPALLTLLPYRRDVAALNGSLLERWFARRGYACLLVDLRGTGSSDGRQRPPFDPAEADDALAAIAWAAEQPWCDGRIGMWGHSYGAMTALRAASRRPPALRAVIAVQGTTDPGGDFVHPGHARGAFSPLGFWGLATLANQLLPPLDDYGDEAEHARWKTRLETGPYLIDLFRHGPDDPVWAERRVDAAAIRTPTLCVAGWRDLFADGTVHAFEQIAGPKRLVAGPWGHTMPHDHPDTPIDFPSLALQWWDQWLRGWPPADASPVCVHIQGDRPHWLGFDHWPPKPAVDYGDLAAWQRVGPAIVDPVSGIRSGLWSTPIGLFSRLPDQHDDDAHSLTITSPPLTQPLLICGRPRVRVENAWPQVSVKLTDVDQAGRSTLICAAVERVPDGGAVEITLAPAGYQIATGHRLRIALAPADFPRVWPVPVVDERPDVTSLALPLVPADEGCRLLEFGLPEPVAADLPDDLELTPPQAEWTITDDLLTGTVTLRVAARTTTIPALSTHGRAHRLHLLQEFVATADRIAPQSSVITGSTTAAVEIESGSRITVTCGLTVTATTLAAAAHVIQDDTVLTEQTWNY